MKKKLAQVLLIDDDSACNFFHERLLRKEDVVEKIQVALDGQEALDYLCTFTDGQSLGPGIIFLDINMPRLDGWAFLDEYKKISGIQSAKIIVVMLTSSLNPDDLEKSKTYPEVKGFYNKYLDKVILSEIIATHFPD